ncbi:hypothetical protein GCM10027341_19870 [Spirosoma knui]
MSTNLPSFPTIAIKTVVTHTVTYFLFGLMALALFDYKELYATTTVRLLMRPVSDPLVAAGPLVQPLRGILFALVFYSLRQAFFGQRSGWLTMWSMLVIIGIFSTFGPAPGSVEGLIYTVLPIQFQLIGLPEVLLQSLSLSFTLCYWVRQPERKWLNWVLGGLFILIVFLLTLGLVVGTNN